MDDDIPATGMFPQEMEHLDQFIHHGAQRNHYITIETPMKELVIEASCDAAGRLKAVEEPHRAGVKTGFD